MYKGGDRKGIGGTERQRGRDRGEEIEGERERERERDRINRLIFCVF
jgi:hypothetical protein